MNEPSHSWVTVGRPVTGLLLLSVTVVFGLGWVVREALRAGRCELDLPWGREISESLLQAVFTVALREADTLRHLSSDCVARLHIDFTAMFVAILIVTLIGAAAICLICGVHVGRLHRKAVGTKALAGFVLMPGILYIMMTTFSTIDFKKTMRRMVTFDGHYIDIYHYSSYLTLSLILSMFMVCGTIALIGFCVRKVQMHFVQA